MQIVIEILEEQYNKIKELKMCEYWNYVALLDAVLTSIKNGTPLPKGHGRLIDVNDLLEDICLEDNDYNRDCNIGEIITLENIDRIPTIIEANKGD